MRSLTQIITLCSLGIFLLSCHEGDKEKSDYGKLVVDFEHFVGNEALVFDEMKYTNAAGNEYEVTEIQYFISDLTLRKDDGEKILLDEDHFAHYIDTNIPETSTWEIAEAIPVGDYTSLTLTFGIKGEKNQPYMFTDAPESDMLWPINLGGDQGGYHYMKLNGFWRNLNEERTPFNFHLGVGQERDEENNIIGFVQNWFEMELPASAFTITGGETKVITIRMDVDQWWENPNIYDHNIQGGKIMQNQDAMRMGVENGISVFEVSNIASTSNTL